MARLSGKRIPGICRIHIYILIMKSSFIKAFKEVLREQILSKNTVELEGFGTFEVIHQKQYQKKYDDGRVVMMPPADIVEFESHIRKSDEN